MQVEVSPKSYMRLLVTVAVLIAVYFLIRYDGYSAETDTRVATTAILHMSTTTELVPPTGYVVYPNGYAYQALGVFVTNISGMSISSFQGLGSNLLIILLILSAWLLYRELTDSNEAATLATVILFVQPEFLFVIARGTHEKFTRSLMFLAMYVLVRSFRSRMRLRRLAIYIVVFYLMVYGIITFNNLLASSYVLALVVALSFTALALRVQSDTTSPQWTIVRRLILGVCTSFVIVFVFTFYAYEPAKHDIQVMESVVDRVVALFLDFEKESQSPYTRWVTGAWTSQAVYFMLSLANWLLLGASSILWLWNTYEHLIRKKPFANINALLLWAFYGAFALQGALSILVDFSGAIAANLQHRLFPSFVMLAAPLVARALFLWQPKDQRYLVWTKHALSIALATLCVFSMLKASNEPLFSNKWIYYSPAEIQTLDWGEQYFKEQRIWTSFDERVSVGAVMVGEGEAPELVLESGTDDVLARNIMISTINQYRAIRLQEDLPIEADSCISYDNGDAQVYHLRPRTPFQK